MEFQGQEGEGEVESGRVRVHRNAAFAGKEVPVAGVRRLWGPGPFEKSRTRVGAVKEWEDAAAGGKGRPAVKKTLLGINVSAGDR